MEYAVIFLPLAGAILGYFGKSLISSFSEIITLITVYENMVLEACHAHVVARTR